MSDRREATMSKSISEDLLAALEKITRPGSFCVTGVAPLVLPGPGLHDRVQLHQQGRESGRAVACRGWMR